MAGKAKRTHISLPQELVSEIDSLVGPRGRSAFLVETARSELRRRKLLVILDSKESIWMDKDHPELGRGAKDWVRSLRAQGERKTASARLKRKAK